MARPMPTLPSGIALGLGLAAVITAGVYASSQPKLASLSPEDLSLQQSLAEMSAVTPAKAAELKAEYERERSRLLTGRQWEAWFAEHGQVWHIDRQADDQADGIAIRRYTLTFHDQALSVWPQVVSAVRELAGQPGTAIESFDCELGSSADEFTKMQLKVSVRVQI